MKKSNAYLILYFAIIIAIACMTSCSSSQHGYDYKSHAKHRNTGPSKCYKKHNNW
jgi:hypothetical protein